MTKAKILRNTQPIQAEIDLPASKSIANRALIVNALSTAPGEIHNLSEARDTQTMQRLLSSKESVLDVLDAGTTMRFLTAYLSVTRQEKMLTGTPRMCERPIGVLVDALVKLGASIEYTEKPGFPPLETKGFNQKTESLSIRGDISSQYISALLMIAPLLNKGLTLHLKGNISSKPYISMTLKVMEYYGINAVWQQNTIHVPHGKYRAQSYRVEPDWSAASYWYSLVGLSENSEVLLKDLNAESIQGDRVIADIMTQLGVKTEFTKEGALLRSSSHSSTVHIDFADCPDLAQTVAVVCAVKGVKGKFTGLESLKIKETDRVKALQNELSKLGAELDEFNDYWELTPGSINSGHYSFKSYDDHRMAMAFAPVAVKSTIEIETPEVVNKSYPRYWRDYEKAGFSYLEI